MLSRVSLLTLRCPVVVSAGQRSFHTALEMPTSTVFGAFQVQVAGKLPESTARVFRTMSTRPSRFTNMKRGGQDKKQSTRVKEYEQQYQQGHQGAPWQSGSVVPGNTQGMLHQEHQEQQRDEDRRPLHEVMSEGARKHLQTVYSLLGSSAGLMAGASALAATVPVIGAVPPIVYGLGALAPLLGLYFTDPKKYSLTFRGGLLGGFSVLSGFAMAPMLKAVALMNPWLIPTALGLTGGIFGGATAFSMMMKPSSTASWGAPLFGGTLVLLGCGIGSMFVSPISPLYPVLHNIYLYGGLGLFTLWVSYDTQQIVADYEQNGENADPLTAAASLLVDMKAIFIRVLAILGMSND